MLQEGPAKKLVIYITATDQYRGAPLYQRLLEFFRDHGCAGATATTGVAGLGPHGVVRKLERLSLREDVPMRIEVVESAERIERLLPFVYDMVEEGLIEVLDTTVVKYAHRERPRATRGGPHVQLKGRGKMLRIYIGEDDRWEGAPLYDAIVKRLRMMDLAGATVYRGVLGYGASKRMHRDSWLHLSADRPVMITVVDTEEKIRRAIPVLDEMIGAGLLVLSDVEVIEYRTGVDWTEEAEPEAPSTEG
jgi:PII-like signaling protein